MAVDDLKTGTWVTYVAGKATTLQIRRSRLEIVSGEGKGTCKDIEASTIRIGARSGVDFVVSDPKVSGIHCEIILDDRGYRLRDLDSTNGTFVGGYRINDMYIHPGTQIVLGNSKIKFEPLESSVELELSGKTSFSGMVGTSVPMRDLFSRIEKVAPTDATVLIGGETGVGKELVAEALHEFSPRSSGPFVVLDCSSIPPSLIESELFGHEKGAFTGADEAHAGVFERAHGGTVFLDEIGELPLSMQPKLLRVLERKELRRVGGAKTLALDIRVVAASNRDLGVEVNRGRFREDLYYRLAVARLRVPPLRERLEDLPLLVEHFVQIIPGANSQQIAPDTVKLMLKHDWPGNVRELRNVIERAVLLSESPAEQTVLRKQQDNNKVAPEPSSHTGSSQPVAAQSEDLLQFEVSTEVPFKVAKQRLINGFERIYIGRLLDEHEGNISAAARAAGIDRMSIHKMLNRLGLHNPGRD